LSVSKVFKKTATVTYRTPLIPPFEKKRGEDWSFSIKTETVTDKIRKSRESFNQGSENDGCI